MRLLTFFANNILVKYKIGNSVGLAGSEMCQNVRTNNKTL